MFQRFHASRERREGGFTLIELLVVILIIAILAAIAIPVFLNQRRKGWESAAKSALKDAATAQESWRTSHTDYTLVVGAGGLKDEGYNATADVGLDVKVATSDRFCMKADHGSLSDNWYFDSNVGAPAKAATTAADCI